MALVATGVVDVGVEGQFHGRFGIVNVFVIRNRLP